MNKHNWNSRLIHCNVNVAILSSCLLQEVAQKLTEIQTKADMEKQEHEKHIRELEQHMEEELAKIVQLEAKIYELTFEIPNKQVYSEHIEVMNNILR